MGSFPVRSSTTLAAWGWRARTSRTMVCCKNGSRAMFAEMDAFDPEREMNPRAPGAPPPPLPPPLDPCPLRPRLIDFVDCEYATTLSLLGLLPNLGLYTCPAGLVVGLLPLSGWVARLVLERLFDRCGDDDDDVESGFAVAGVDDSHAFSRAEYPSRPWGRAQTAMWSGRRIVSSSGCWIGSTSSYASSSLLFSTSSLPGKSRSDKSTGSWWSHSSGLSLDLPCVVAPAVVVVVVPFDFPTPSSSPPQRHFNTNFARGAGHSQTPAAACTMEKCS
mmetsp:Transcript_14275/g.23208  ORF Transcript_14275/g.23208 Transcript_14275/m.23208 type:complete len:275 (-) Transcript_14275:15-839(-)